MQPKVAKKVASKEEQTAGLGCNIHQKKKNQFFNYKGTHDSPLLGALLGKKPWSAIKQWHRGCKELNSPTLYELFCAGQFDTWLLKTINVIHELKISYKLINKIFSPYLLLMIS